MIGFRLQQTALLGIRSLALHKLRSVLTVLGIIFGVSSVIAMLSIGEGAQHAAQEEIKKMGSQNVIIKSVKPAEEQGSGYQRTDMLSYGILRKDYRRMRDTVSPADVIVPMRMVPVDARYGREKIDVQLVGTEPQYIDVGNISLQRPGIGRFLRSNDVERALPVAVIGAHVSSTLYPAQDPLGTQIKLGTNVFRVIGVLEETGAASGTGGVEADDRNNNVYIPLTTMDARHGDVTVRVVSGSRSMEKVQLHQVIVGVRAVEYVSATARAIRGMLELSHKSEDFEVIVPLELLEQRERTKRIFNIVLGSIAAISLLVGGIGIMNIMLASITERTREIGIRRALGAKKRDIVTQFLVETVVLSTTGGLLGIVLGVAVPWVVESMSGMPTIITTWSLLISFGISAGIGIVFGLYPANRAAAMDPIEALRRE